jgi:ParB family chromosome partitioning protein
MPDVETGKLREHPANVRESAGGIEEMAASIRAHGILQPLIVQPNPAEPGTFLILAGHRRFLGACAAGLRTVPVIVRPAAGAKAIEIMLIENCQRADLGPVEKAEAMGKLRRRGMTATGISRAIGLSVSTVSYFLSLLDLDAASLERVRQGQVPVGTAVKAVRATRKQQRGGPAGRAVVKPRTDHFSRKHPLAGKARIRCQLAGHTSATTVMYGRDKSAGGNVACGECWEYVIRASERGEQLPEDTTAPTARQERIQQITGAHFLTGTSAHPDGAHITARQAAAQLGVTPRTIERYKRDLKRAPA